MITIILIHVAIALTSLVFTAYALFAPSSLKLKVSYTLTGLTVASGTYLVVMAPTHMPEACMTGLVYLGIMFVMIAVARYRLAMTTESETI